MTQREPDRYDAKARETFRSLVMDEVRAVPMIAAALRQAAAEALERAAQALAPFINARGEWASLAHPIEVIRALASPAAAPAAEPSEHVAPALLPRVLAALETSSDPRKLVALAAELRRYIAGVEGGK